MKLRYYKPLRQPSGKIRKLEILLRAWRNTRRGVAVILAILATILVTSLVLAHATLSRSDPADGAILAESPREVHLWFDENISPRFSSAQLFDANSQPLEIVSIRTDPNDPQLLSLTLPELSSGVYSVLWKVLSETDGHFNQGLLVFGVGTEADLGAVVTTETITASPPFPEVLLRWFNFSLLAGLIGAVAVSQLVLIPVGHALGEEAAVASVRGIARRRVLGWAGWCAGLALVVGLGLLLWQTITLSETLPEGASLQGVGWQILSRTRWGGLWLARQSILLALTGIVFWLGRAATKRRNRGVLILLIVDMLLLALVTVQTLTGHASAITPNTSLAAVADMLHLLAASLWIGSLLALVVGLLPLLRRDRTDFAVLVRASWGPFSRLAALSVGLVVATGLYSAGRQVASVDALITTLYGQALLGKISLMLGVGAFGLLNAMLLHPRLAAPVARLLGRPGGWTPLSLRRLPTLVSVEAGLGLLIFLVTGLITAAPAPRGPEFTVVPEEVPTSLSQLVDDVLVTLSVKPNRPGQNVFTVFAASTRRPPPAEIIRVILRFTYLDQDLGRVSATTEEVEAGRFLIGGNYLSLAGPWQIDVVVRRKGVEDSVARFNWLVAPPGETRPVVISKQPLEAPLTIAAAGIILIVLFVGAGVWLSRNRARRLMRVQDQTYSYLSAISEGRLQNEINYVPKTDSTLSIISEPGSRQL
jgi:copper transport protein